jgi:hypothetical protein
VLRQKLFQLNYGREACIEPTWSTFKYDAETLDGPACTVTSKAYKDPVWHDECIYLTQSALLQAIGRARPILETGIPVLVFSNSLLHQLPYAPDYPAGGATPGLMDAVESVWRICQQKPVARNRDVVADLDKDKGNIARTLKAATDCGFIERVSRGAYRPVRPPGRDDMLPNESCKIA